MTDKNLEILASLRSALAAVRAQADSIQSSLDALEASFAAEASAEAQDKSGASPEDYPFGKGSAPDQPSPLAQAAAAAEASAEAVVGSGEASGPAEELTADGAASAASSIWVQEDISPFDVDEDALQSSPGEAVPGAGIAAAEVSAKEDSRTSLPRRDDFPASPGVAPEPSEAAVTSEQAEAAAASEPSEASVAPEPSEAAGQHALSEVHARPAVIDVMSDRYAWKTDIPGSPVRNILSAISLNDRLLFINTLFDKDAAAFQKTISLFNSLSSLAEAETYIRSHFPQWDMKSEVVYRFMMAVRRKLL